MSRKGNSENEVFNPRFVQRVQQSEEGGGSNPMMVDRQPKFLKRIREMEQHQEEEEDDRRPQNEFEMSQQARRFEEDQVLH